MIAYFLARSEHTPYVVSVPEDKTERILWISSIVDHIENLAITGGHSSLHGWLTLDALFHHGLADVLKMRTPVTFRNDMQNVKQTLWISPFSRLLQRMPSVVSHFLWMCRINHFDFDPYVDDVTYPRLAIPAPIWVTGQVDLFQWDLPHHALFSGLERRYGGDVMLDCRGLIRLFLQASDFQLNEPSLITKETFMTRWFKQAFNVCSYNNTNKKKNWIRVAENLLDRTTVDGEGMLLMSFSFFCIASKRWIICQPDITKLTKPIRSKMICGEFQDCPRFSQICRIYEQKMDDQIRYYEGFRSALNDAVTRECKSKQSVKRAKQRAKRQGRVPTAPPKPLWLPNEILALIWSYTPFGAYEGKYRME
jgi:hypothetical protein